MEQVAQVRACRMRERFCVNISRMVTGPSWKAGWRTVPLWILRLAESTMTSCTQSWKRSKHNEFPWVVVYMLISIACALLTGSILQPWLSQTLTSHFTGFSGTVHMMKCYSQGVTGAEMGHKFDWLELSFREIIKWIFPFIANYSCVMSCPISCWGMDSPFLLISLTLD